MGMLPETNSEFTPENGWFDDEFQVGMGPIFQGRPVSFTESTGFSSMAKYAIVESFVSMKSVAKFDVTYSV